MVPPSTRTRTNRLDARLTTFGAGNHDKEQDKENHNQCKPQTERTGRTVGLLLSHCAMLYER